LGTGPRRSGPTEPKRVGARDGTSSLVLQGIQGARPSSMPTHAGAMGWALSPSASKRPGRRGPSRSRTQGAWRATHASERGHRDAPAIAVLGAAGGPHAEARERPLKRERPRGARSSESARQSRFLHAAERERERERDESAALTHLSRTPYWALRFPSRLSRANSRVLHSPSFVLTRSPLQKNPLCAERRQQVPDPNPILCFPPAPAAPWLTRQDQSNQVPDAPSRGKCLTPRTRPGAHDPHSAHEVRHKTVWIKGIPIIRELRERAARGEIDGARASSASGPIDDRVPVLSKGRLLAGAEHVIAAAAPSSHCAQEDSNGVAFDRDTSQAFCPTTASTGSPPGHRAVVMTSA
jgi:hypothetical protein